MSEKEVHLNQVTTSLQQAQDQAATLQSTVTELWGDSKSLNAQLSDQHIAFKTLQKQHSELQRATSAKDAKLPLAVQARDTQHLQSSQAAAMQDVSFQELTTARQASCQRVASLEATVQELTKRSDGLQQQLSAQQQACVDLSKQHAVAHESLSTAQADTAAEDALEAELGQLKECLKEKDASLQHLKAVLATSELQVQALRSAAAACQPDEKTPVFGQSRSVVAGSAAQAAADGDSAGCADSGPFPQVTQATPTADLADPAPMASAGTSQMQGALAIKGEECTQLKRRLAHIKKQHTELEQQHQASRAVLTQNAENSARLNAMAQQLAETEASLTEKNIVIENLQCQLANQAGAHCSRPSTTKDTDDGTLEGLRLDDQQEEMDATLDISQNASGRPDSMAKSARSFSMAHASSPQPAGLQGPPADSSDVKGSPSLAASTSFTSLSMPEGSVDNPLAQQPDSDDDHVALSPEMSALLGSSGSDSEDQVFVSKALKTQQACLAMVNAPPAAVTAAAVAMSSAPKADPSEQHEANAQTPSDLQQVWLHNSFMLHLTVYPNCASANARCFVPGNNYFFKYMRHAANKQRQMLGLCQVDCYLCLLGLMGMSDDL